MRIKSIQTVGKSSALAHPYAIASASFDAANIFYVKIESDCGVAGFGAASPMGPLTNEHVHDCARALAPETLNWMLGQSIDDIRPLLANIEASLPRTPAARSALEIAIYDLFAKRSDRPLVDVLGRVHDVLPTSVTIGIVDEATMLEEAHRWVGMGFTRLKLKIGGSIAKDLGRLQLLRQALPEISVRIDANQAYSVRDTIDLIHSCRDLNLEFFEQPFAASTLPNELHALNAELRGKIALDESLASENDTDNYISANARFGVANIKVMKFGFESARRVAKSLAANKQSIMWGCVDESVISITAALHLAYATTTTKYLDLDGHLGLDDLAQGGLEILAGGMLALNDESGLGVHIPSGVFE